MSDIVKALWGKLYAWALPSALMMGAFWLLVYPSAPSLHGWIRVTDSSEKAAVFLALTAALAFALNAFSAPLYRILEGYLLWPKRLQSIAVERQLCRKKKLQDCLGGNGWARGLALEELSRYPLRDEQVAPTRFGNALRAFETYGKTRFNLDSQTLWYELCASAPKNIQTEIDKARSSVDFFVAMTYLSFLFAIVSLFLAVAERGPPSILIASAGAFFLALLCHWFALRTTVEWGYTVQALVNTSRIKLAEQMGLQLPATLEEEKEMWGLVTSYAFFAAPQTGNSLNRFRSKEPKKPSGSSSSDKADDNSDDEG